MIRAYPVLLLAAGMAGSAAAGPISFNAALTLSSNEFVVREQGVWDQSGHDPGGGSRDRLATGVDSVLGYGVDEDLSVFAVLPYRRIRLDVTTGAERRRRQATGVGDLRLFGRYVLVRRNWTARAFRLSAFAGGEIPTGEDDRRDRFGRLPADVQPGSGSWDGFGGLTATYQTLDFEIDAQLAYRANTEANDFTFGDVVRADASAQYRLWPRSFKGGIPGFLYAVLEANLIHARRNRSGGHDDANSGGATLFLAPGLQYVTKRWIFEAAAQFPAIQNLNGTALEKDFVARAGFRVNF